MHACRVALVPSVEMSIADDTALISSLVVRIFIFIFLSLLLLDEICGCDSSGLLPCIPIHRLLTQGFLQSETFGKMFNLKALKVCEQ